MRGMVVATALAFSMLGLAGCASMVGNGPHSAYALAQNVTGSEAHQGYDALALLDKVATPNGGGLFNDKTPATHNRLAHGCAGPHAGRPEALLFRPCQRQAAADPPSAGARGLADTARQQQPGDAR